MVDLMVSEQRSGTAGKGVPAGFKMSEVGVIPQDWGVYSLGELSISIASGKTNTQSNGEYPLYGSTGLIGTCKSGEYEGYALLIARVGANAGRLNFVTGEYGVSDNTLIVKIKPQYNISLFYYILLQKNLNSLIFGSGQPLITGSLLKKIIIAVPGEDEQNGIANVLIEIDTLIIKLEKLLSKKQAIKTATMQQLLTGKTRLPQYALRDDGSAKGYKKNELGEIPEDWIVSTFGSIMKIRHGKNQKHVECLDGEYPIYATGGQIGKANAFLYNKPSVLIGRKGTIDKPRYTDKPFWTVDTLFYSEISESADAQFIYYKFCMIDWMQYNEASGVPSLNAGTIESIQTVLPSIKEQTAIASILSDMDKDIQTLQQRLEKTRQLKQGMMQELLTGKTRLI